MTFIRLTTLGPLWRFDPFANPAIVAGGRFSGEAFVMAWVAKGGAR